MKYLSSTIGRFYDSVSGAANSMLRTLDLRHNKIDNLQRDCFRGLRNLQQLHMTGNSLAHVGAGSFVGLDSLPVLDLSGQQIRYKFFGLICWSRFFTCVGS